MDSLDRDALAAHPSGVTLSHIQQVRIMKVPNTETGRAAEDTVVQAYGSLTQIRLALPEQARRESVAALNRLLAHTMAIRDLYKKAHWQASGATFYQLHLLFDKHYGEQIELMDALAERVQTFGGVALALARDVAEESRITRAPRGREAVPAQLSRLIEAHELILDEARPLAREASERGTMAPTTSW
ncbi:MAG: DNA starvation/stationary phase protection protein [Steroidobacteraceae bacterium]